MYVYYWISCKQPDGFYTTSLYLQDIYLEVKGNVVSKIETGDLGVVGVKMKQIIEEKNAIKIDEDKTTSSL